jgi:tetrapyrrole methylase family protein / MazG family protein
VSDSKRRVVAVGLGPSGPELVPAATRDAISRAHRVFLRTERHPSASVVREIADRVETFDPLYERASSFEEVYAGIVEALVAAAVDGEVVYVVPGSPLVAERTVQMLRSDGRIALEVVPAMSFMDLVWERIGTDPVASSVRIIDATDFASQAAGERGPLLVAQAHSRGVLSQVKLAVEDPPTGESAATLLHHLGLEDEVVLPLRWSELDRQDRIEPDHLTSVWIPSLEAPVASEVVKLVDLVRTLRVHCPWDRQQTHGSLGRHLLEESYETLDAIEDLAADEPDVPSEKIDHLEEELGDLMLQVVFHAVLASEEGRFDLADVARKVHDKLVGRHPHVFGDAVANTPEDVARRWESLKRDEQGRRSIVDGIPNDLPALTLAAKLQRKAESVGISGRGVDDDRAAVLATVEHLSANPAGSSGETLEADRETKVAIGQALLAMADLARRAGVDPESALRASARTFASEIRAVEGGLH